MYSILDAAMYKIHSYVCLTLFNTKSGIKLNVRRKSFLMLTGIVYFTRYT